MRFERTITSISWIPSDALAGMAKLGTKMGVAHDDLPPPDHIGTDDAALDELRGVGPVPLRQPAPGLGRGRGWPDRRPRLRRRRPHGGDHAGPRCHRGDAAGRRPPRPSPSPRGRRRLGAVHPDDGRSHGRPAAADREAPTLCAIPGATRLDDLAAHDPRRRHVSGSCSAPVASPATGSTATTARSPARPGSPTTRTGTATPSASARRGASSTRRRWSPPWRPPSSASCRRSIMRGGERPEIRKLKAGKLLVEQGAPGAELFLLLDGVLSVEVDGEPIAELGPGAVLGERAVLEGGQRTSSLRAVTACRVAVAAAEQLDLDHLRSWRRAIAGKITALPDARPPLWRARVDAGRRARVRGSRRPHVVRGRRPRRRRGADAGARRGHRLAAAHRRCSTASRSAARSCSATCTGTTPRAFRSSPAATGPTPRCACCIPAQGADPLELLSRGMGPPHFPITPDGPPRRPGPSTTSSEGTHDLEGFEVLAREIPHPGGRAFGYRVSDGRTSMAYLSDHGPIALGPGPDGWGPYHDAALPSPTASTCSCTTRSTPPRSSRRGRRSGTPRPSTPCSWPSGPAPAGWSCSTTIPSRTDDEVEALAERLGRGETLPIEPAIEGATIQL